jgi:hypothetical protein
MAFSPASPNAFDVNLIPREVRNKYFLEVLMQTNLNMFMGSQETSMIQIVRKEKGSGLTSTFALAKDIDYELEGEGYDQISGKGQELKFYEDTININLKWHIDKLQGTQLVGLTTPIDVYGRLKPALVRAHTQKLVSSILRSGTFGSYAANFAAGPVIDRVQYGTSATPGANYDASMIVAADALVGNTAANGGLSVQGITNLRDMAINGGTSYGANRKLTPYMLKSNQGAPDPYWVYMMSTASYQSLKADANWDKFVYRGTIESANQPSRIKGSFFKGQIENVLIYECPELGKFKLGTAQGFARDNAWNLFCGAQAFGVMWHGSPWFAQEVTNMGTCIEMARLEFRGEKSIKFPSYRASDNGVSIENGIIHHIVRLAA